MSRLLLFNPENDLALASNALSYTPTTAAQAMRGSGALLPLWWSEPGDELLVPPQLLDTARRICRQWNLPALPATEIAAQTAMPWGWSRSTRRELASLGVGELPDDNQIQSIRSLSHRRTAINILRALGTDPCMMPMEFTDASEAISAIDHMGDAVLKMPWSGSGRGVFHTNHISRAMLVKTVQDIIHRQGSIIVEHELDKLRDFATLYYSNGHEVQYRGLSLFINDTHGHYQGNLLMPQPRLMQLLSVDILPLTTRIEQILTQIIAPHYTGWMGVDMMLYKDSNNDTKVWPCIELNLRLTMGVLALYAAERTGIVGRLAASRQTPPPEAINLSPTGGPIAYLITPSK